MSNFELLTFRFKEEPFKKMVGKYEIQYGFGKSGIFMNVCYPLTS